MIEIVLFVETLAIILIAPFMALTYLYIKKANKALENLSQESKDYAGKTAEIVFPDGERLTVREFEKADKERLARKVKAAFSNHE